MRFCNSMCRFLDRECCATDV